MSAWAAYWKIPLVIVLVASISARNLVVKASQRADAKIAYSSFAVTMLCEALKFSVSGLLLLRDLYFAPSDDVPPSVDAVSQPQIQLKGVQENLAYLGPALLFTVSNNLYFLIVERLNPATISLVWNLKIVATALMLRLLGRTIGTQQWAAVAILTIGVMVSQGGGADTASSDSEGYTTGLLLCLVCICINVLSNVLCEFLFKRTRANQYAQYMRLYTGGFLANFLCLLAKDTDAVARGDSFHNFNRWTSASVVVIGLAGFLVGMTFKHLDNIAVVFADVSAMLVVAIISWCFFDFQLSASFIGGMFLCVCALWLYYQKESPAELSFKYQAVAAAPSEDMFGAHTTSDEGFEMELASSERICDAEDLEDQERLEQQA